tara:strand:- start:35840 stop:37141 length:1302 start_codon:yes stop_codon:yes gene_type:complete
MLGTRFLERLVRHIIQIGNLTITFADGVNIHIGDGSGPPVHLRFKSSEAERAVAFDPGLKLGECYMDGDIEFLEGDILKLLEMVFTNAKGDVIATSPWLTFVERARRIAYHIMDWNTLRKSRSNVQHHYDLSGALYDLFLDPDRQYSCAYFEDPSMDLEQAQLAKKRHIASKLIMDRENLKVLDIGSGWGGMGLHLARQFNARVTGVTLSDEQFTMSNQRAREDGFSGQVDFKLLDYRNLEETYDRIVSVGMFEHVGTKHYATYFNKCAAMLNPDGVMLLHTIGQFSGPTPTNPFIKKHIFPGGHIPSLSQIVPSIERAGLVITDIEVLRFHYAETLKAWRSRFLDHWDEAKVLYDERFCRMWDFYLASSEASFRWQDLEVFQIQLAHRMDAVPMTRDYIGKNGHVPHRAKKASASAKKKLKTAPDKARQRRH